LPVPKCPTGRSPPWADEFCTVGQPSIRRRAGSGPRRGRSSFRVCLETALPAPSPAATRGKRVGRARQRKPSVRERSMVWVARCLKRSAGRVAPSRQANLRCGRAGQQSRRGDPDPEMPDTIRRVARAKVRSPAEHLRFLAHAAALRTWPFAVDLPRGHPGHWARSHRRPDAPSPPAPRGGGGRRTPARRPPRLVMGHTTSPSP
jgi:hypothetical protein